jgi:hypothetical protein
VATLGLAAVSAAAVGWMPPQARACNACLEDKIAATYDWHVVAQAARVGHAIVFIAIRGPVRPGDAPLERALARQLGALPGVDRGSVRVSLAPPAASFACDPGGGSPQRIIASMSKVVANHGLSLELIRVEAPGVAKSSGEGDVR